MNFLIVDDHPIIVLGVKRILKENFEVDNVDHAEDGHHASVLLKNNTYNMCILDLVLPNTDTHSLLKQVLSQQTSCKVLIYSSSPDEVYAMNYIREGASGFVNKNAPTEEFLGAVKMILNGKMYISEGVLRTNLTPSGLGGSFDNPFQKLSKRELELLSHLLKGRKNVEISKVLNIEQSTTATLKGRLMRKLGVTSVVDLMALAREYRLDA
jgi:DNA-binding NarL/FixJ family response regulator